MDKLLAPFKMAGARAVDLVPLGVALAAFVLYFLLFTTEGIFSGPLHGMALAVKLFCAVYYIVRLVQQKSPLFGFALAFCLIALAGDLFGFLCDHLGPDAFFNAGFGLRLLAFLAEKTALLGLIVAVLLVVWFVFQVNRPGAG